MEYTAYLSWNDVIKLMDVPGPHSLSSPELPGSDKYILSTADPDVYRAWRQILDAQGCRYETNHQN